MAEYSDILFQDCQFLFSFYAVSTGEIWKHSFFSAFSPTAILIRHENGAFRKRSSNWGNLKMPALRFRAGREHFKRVENDR